MLRFQALFALLRDNLRRNPFFFIAASFGITLGVAVLVFFVGLGLGLKKHVADRFFQALPETRLKITATGLDMGLLNLARPGFIKPEGLSDAFLQKAGKQPGVERAFGELSIAFPVQVVGSFFGKEAASDLVATGLDPAIIAPDLTDPSRFAYHEDGPVPVVVARSMLDLYNTSFAPMNGFPPLKPETIIGFRFDLVLGSSYLGGNSGQGKVRRVTCELVGFSPKAVPLGITLPSEYVRRFNEEYTGRGDHFSAVYVDAKSPARVDALKAWGESQGYNVQTAKEGASREIGRLIDFVTGLFAGLSGLIMSVAALNLAFLLYLMLHRRMREIGLWRTLGATRLEMGLLVLMEAGLVGLVGGLLGLAIGQYVAHAFEAEALASLRTLPLAPAALFDFPPWLSFSSVGYAVAASIVGALAPAWRAARLDCIRAIKL